MMHNYTETLFKVNVTSSGKMASAGKRRVILRAWRIWCSLDHSDSTKVTRLLFTSGPVSKSGGALVHTDSAEVT